MSRPVITQDTVKALIDAARVYRQDIKALANKLEATQGPVIGSIQYQLKNTQDVTTGQPVEFSSSALSQLLSKLNVRTDFYNKCPPFLQEQIFNWFASHSKTECLLRLDPKKDMSLPENQTKPTTI